MKQKYISCDGTLTLLVYKDDDDWIVGFENSEWHIHGNQLIPEYGNSPAMATENFIKAILEDRELIAISESPNKPSIISIADAPESEKKYKLPEEILTFRTWSGKREKDRMGCERQ